MTFKDIDGQTYSIQSIVSVGKVPASCDDRQVTLRQCIKNYVETKNKGIIYCIKKQHHISNIQLPKCGIAPE